MGDNLKSREYYEEIYDLLTIKDCLRHKQYFQPSKASNNNLKQLLGNLSLYYLKGNQYKERENTINEWMTRDKKLDNLVDSVNPSSSIFCQKCNTVLQFTFKHIHESTSEKPRVMLWYECPKCKKRAAYFDDGEQFNSKPTLCKKCNRPAETKYSKKDEILTTEHICHSCNWKEKDIWDMKKDDQIREKEQKKDRELLDKYRIEFCMTPEEGRKYIQSLATMEHISKTVDEWNQKKADPRYQKAQKIKKMSIIELENYLAKFLVQEKYLKLSFDKPEIDRYVIASFTVQDAKAGRAEYDSSNTLKKLLKKNLENTNWRLMSEGLIYRLGYLTGRLKGYEREEDIIAIMEMKHEKK